MSFTEAIRSGFSNYSNFAGRSTRSAYWWWILFQSLFFLVTLAVDGVLYLISSGSIANAPITGLVGLALWLPGWAVSVRRLHDIGRSGWWLLLGLVPIVGWIILLIWVCTKSEPGTNRFDAPSRIVSFEDAVASAWSNYATFSGRTRRSAYWWWILATSLFGSAANTVDAAVFGQERPYLTGLAWLAMLIPTIAVAARRLHDIDRTGWWQLIWFIPVIGWIILLIWYCTRSQEGPNRFGPSPYGT